MAGFRPQDIARLQATMSRIQRIVTSAALPLAVGTVARRAHEMIEEGALVNTGDTRASTQTDIEPDGLTATVSIGGAAVFQEFGTKPHTIRPRTASVLAFKVGGKTVFARKVEHPGTTKKPFVRPAADMVRVELPKEVSKAVVAGVRAS